MTQQKGSGMIGESVVPLDNGQPDYHVDMPDDRDPETGASFRVQGLARYCFGNRWQFAVECEVQDCERDP